MNSKMILTLGLLLVAGLAQAAPSSSRQVQASTIKNGSAVLNVPSSSGTLAKTTDNVSSATTATSLASNPTDCSAGQKATAIDAQGNLTCSATSLTSDVSGTLPVGNGGSGATSFTANYVLLGNGSSAFQTVAPSTSGNVLQSNGSTWISASPGAATYTAPVTTVLTATGTTSGYLFTTSSANATIGATFTNNSNTYTVLATIAAGTQLFCSGTSAPTSSGTLTKSSGTGDSTITFSATQALATFTLSGSPLYLEVEAVGGGSGGSGSGTNAGSNGNSNSATMTAFGAGTIVANGGGGAAWNSNSSAGGSVTTVSGGGITVSGLALTGGNGGGGDGYLSSATVSPVGGNGANGPFGGGGGGGSGGGPNGASGFSGNNAAANTGSGGGGGGGNSGQSSCVGGTGGSAGGYFKGRITGTLPSTFVYTIGLHSNGGSARTGGDSGGNGADGILIITQRYQ